MSTPDLSQKVLGYRQFVVRDGGLCSVGVGNLHWLPGPNHARCAARLSHSQYAQQMRMISGGPYVYHESRAPARHSAPAAACHCGLYGLHAFIDDWLDGHMSMTEHGLTVVGAILGWGKMEVHRSGYRAEWAEVVLLGYDPWIGVRKIAEAQEVARIYGVRAVDLERFVEEAPRMGERLPDSLLPAVPKPQPFPSGGGMYYSGGFLPSSLVSGPGSASGISVGFSSNVDQGADTEKPAPTRRVRSRSTVILTLANLLNAVAQAIMVSLTGNAINAAVLAVCLLGAVFMWFGVPTWREVPA